jgi:hypothetical protein
VIAESYFIDSDTVWVMLITDNRWCYYGIKTNEIPEGKIVLNTLKEIAEEKEFDPINLPHIEDTDPVLQDLWKGIVGSENNMLFIDAPGVDEFAWEPWTEMNITQIEYEDRLDKEIEKYHLEDVITKNEDDCTLYTVYGNLMSSFSGDYNSN